MRTSKSSTHISARLKSDRDDSLAVTFGILMHFVANYEATESNMTRQTILQIRVVKFLNKVNKKVLLLGVKKDKCLEINLLFRERKQLLHPCVKM